MSGTLKDLAPAEKQKVARLICQVVEKERQLKELQAAAAEWQQQQGSERAREGDADAQPADPAVASKADQLAEQNQELARENTSLRAKLSHAFDLLRAYQHKCRVLEATVQVTGSVAGSRPTTPGWGWGDASLPLAGLHPQQLASRLETFEGSSDGTLYRSGTTASEEAAAAAAGGGLLSPVAEGAWEGASPDRPPAAAAAAFGQQQQQRQWQQPDILQLRSYSQTAQHPPGTTEGAAHADTSAGLVGAGLGAAAAAGPDSIQLVAPQGALPQLDTLRLLAQALLEAQAEVAAKQQQQHQYQHPQWQQQQNCGAAGAPASWPASVTPAPCAPAPSRGSLAFDASLGPHGGYLVGPPAGAPVGGGPGKFVPSNCGTGAAAAAPAGEADIAQPFGRSPLAAVQQQAWGPERCASSSSSCLSTAQQAPQPHAAAHRNGSTHVAGAGSLPTRQFDGCLLDLVMDVEGIGMGMALPGEAPSWQGHGGRESWGFGDDRGGSLAACGPQYEENDLLALISQL